MEHLPHSLAGWMQVFAYVLIVVNPGVFLACYGFFNRYACEQGRMVAGVGALLTFAAMDAVIPKVLIGLATLQGGDETDMYSGLLDVPASAAFTLAAIGLFLVYWGTHSIRFVAPEDEARRAQDRRNDAAELRARSTFVSRGTLMNVRVSRVPGGLLTSPDTLTEIETTDGIVVVEGEVGSVQKGASVTGDGYGRIRVEGIPGTLQLRAR